VSDSSDPAALLERHFEYIGRVTAGIAFRNGFDPAEADEFRSWTFERLIDNGYAVVRKFHRRGSFKGYLAVVLSRFSIDYRNERWGRWRVSAAAKRIGPPAPRLECLVYRDGRSVDEALQILRAEGVAEAEPELRAMLAELPPRVMPRTVGLDLAIDQSEEGTADGPLLAAERLEEKTVTESLLSEVLSDLDPEDLVILQLRFWHDMTVADIARTLRLPQKPLYRRVEALQARLRRELERRGIDRGAVAAFVDQELPA